MLYATNVQGNDFAPTSNLVINGIQPTTGAGWTVMNHHFFGPKLRMRQRGTARAFTGNVTSDTDRVIPWPFQSVVTLSNGIPILLMAPPIPPRR